MNEIAREVVKSWVVVIGWLTACGGDEMPHEWGELMIEAVRCLVRLLSVVIVTLVMLLGLRELTGLPGGVLELILGGA